MKSKKKVYLALFVDDGLAACKLSRVLDKMIECLKGTFEITIGDASRFIGLQIVRNRHDKTMFIHQSEYVEQILKKFKMIDAKVVSILADPHAVLSPVENEGEIDNRSPYQEAVWSLMFLTVMSRPDLAFAVNTVAKFLNKHNLSRWKAVKRIFAYLTGKKNLGITYRSGGKNPELVGYCDSDYADDIEIRRSTSGYAFTYANGLVTWSIYYQV